MKKQLMKLNATMSTGASMPMVILIQNAASQKKNRLSWSVMSTNGASMPKDTGKTHAVNQKVKVKTMMISI